MAIPKEYSIFEPELAAVLAAFPVFPPFSAETIPALREGTNITAEQVVAATNLTHEEITIKGPGSDLILSIFRPKVRSAAAGSQANRPGIFHIHGGGMLIMNRFAGVEPLEGVITDCDAVLVTIEYRLAPEHPAPAQLDDCYAGLVWMFENAKKLGVDPDRIMIAGASAGGNLSAGVALLAKDRGGPKLLAQVLMCPMLDNNNNSGSTLQLGEIGTWQKHQNETAWKMYLNGRAADKYTAPARAKDEDLKGLPPTYIDVGALEIFRDEDIEYAKRLLGVGIPTELHVWPGAFHAFEYVAPQAVLSKHTAKTRASWMKKLFEQGKPKL
jgi:acetyl esterase/lipase